MSCQLYSSKSKIHGNGLFTKQPIQNGTKLFLVGDLTKFLNKEDWITPMGKLINHQKNANTILLREGDLFFLYAFKNIEANEELTSNYEDAPAPFIKKINGFKEV